MCGIKTETSTVDSCYDLTSFFPEKTYFVAILRKVYVCGLVYERFSLNPWYQIVTGNFVKL